MTNIEQIQSQAKRRILSGVTSDEISSMTVKQKEDWLIKEIDRNEDKLSALILKLTKKNFPAKQCFIDDIQPRRGNTKGDILIDVDVIVPLDAKKLHKLFENEDILLHYKCIFALESRKGGQNQVSLEGEFDLVIDDKTIQTGVGYHNMLEVDFDLDLSKPKKILNP